MQLFLAIGVILQLCQPLGVLVPVAVGQIQWGLLKQGLVVFLIMVILGCLQESVQEGTVTGDLSSSHNVR